MIILSHHLSTIIQTLPTTVISRSRTTRYIRTTSSSCSTTATTSASIPLAVFSDTNITTISIRRWECRARTMALVVLLKLTSSCRKTILLLCLLATTTRATSSVVCTTTTTLTLPACRSVATLLHVLPRLIVGVTSGRQVSRGLYPRRNGLM